MKQSGWEEKKENSVKLLKETIETKINELTESNNRLKRKLFNLQALYEFGSQSSSASDLNSLLENIIFTCTQCLEVQEVLIAVQGTLDDKLLSFTKVKGIGIKRNWEFSLKSSLAIYLKEKNRPLLLKELIQGFESELFQDSSAKELQTLKELDLVIITPLVIRNQLRGVLLLGDKVSGLSYSENDLEFLTALLSQASILIENLLLQPNQNNRSLEFKETQLESIQKERLELLQELSVAIAQKINNPLGIIKNYLTILSQALKKNDKSQVHLKVIKEEVDRIALSLKQFLYLYSPRAGAKTFIDIGTLLEDTLSSMEEEFSRSKIYLKKKIQPDLPKIEVFPEELRQIFLNLLLNSAVSLPEGGDIEVCVGLKEDKLEIEFKDTRSMAEEVFSNPEILKISENRRLELGLWVSSEIIKKHNGKITIRKREDGKGSWVLLSLPIQDAKVEKRGSR